MDPRIYVPAYLERLYIQEHPGLTEGARELVREQIAAEPEMCIRDRASSSGTSPRMPTVTSRYLMPFAMSL